MGLYGKIPHIMPQEKKATIFPWSMSATGDWPEGTGLHLLRDESPNNIAQGLCMQGERVIPSAIYEITVHGNPRKAAEVARRIVEQDPTYEEVIRKSFGRAAETILETPLEELASRPSEYPEDVLVEFIQ
mgnify:CR=1 FL=1